jgi:1-phosphatidylinositol phosphodiesterase
MGVRLFDIRLQLRENELMVVHSFVDQKQTFESVLKTVNEFLNTHPSEFVFLSIKKDADTENSTVAFEKEVEDMLNSHLGERLSKNTTVPQTLGEARGKVHIISRYANSSLGIPASNGWQDSASFELGELYVQDYYAIESIERKMDDVRSAFDKANGSYGLVLNFTSCYLDKAFPPTNAPKAAKKINPELLEILKNNDTAPCVFLCDFVTPELVQAIIENNFEK